MPDPISAPMFQGPVPEPNGNNILVNKMNPPAQPANAHDEFVANQNNLKKQESSLKILKGFAISSFSALTAGLLVGKAAPFLGLGSSSMIGMIAGSGAAAILLIAAVALIYMAFQATKNYIEAGEHAILGNKTPEEALRDANKENLEEVKNPLIIGFSGRSVQ